MIWLGIGMVVAVATVVTVVVIQATGGTSVIGPAVANATLKIGFMGDLTGENSIIVIPPFQGAQLAVDEYNATNPPTKIELVKYDSQAKSDQAVALATKAAQQDKVVGMIGPAFSGESKAADAILEQGEIPNVTPSATNPGLSTNGWKYFHRLVATDDPQGKGIAGSLASGTTPRRRASGCSQACGGSTGDVGHKGRAGMRDDQGRPRAAGHSGTQVRRRSCSTRWAPNVAENREMERLTAEVVPH